MTNQESKCQSTTNYSDLVESGVMNLIVIGPCFFIAATMGLAIITGGTFTVGTHLLMYWEGIVYSIVGLVASCYAFYVYNFK